MLKEIGLQFFADEGASAVPMDTGNDASVEASAEPQQVEQKASFDDLLKDADYKKAYDTKVDKAIKDRFRKSDAERKKLDPMFEALGRKYGLDTSDMRNFDMNALTDKVLADDSLFEQEAADQGMTVEGYRKVKEAERMMAEQQQAQEDERQFRNFDALQKEAEALKEIYPSLSFEQEFEDPLFIQQATFLQEAGKPNPFRTVYEQKHLQDILGGGMQYAVQKTKQQISQSIQSGMARPKENGSAVPTKTEFDPHNMTRQQREDIRKRVARGEKIVL